MTISFLLYSVRNICIFYAHFTKILFFSLFFWRSVETLIPEFGAMQKLAPNCAIIELRCAFSVNVPDP
jgi:hypothetical protein